jgi:type II secretion system protein I
MRRQRGLTLLEVLVALVVLAVGVTAMQRLLARSVRGIDTDARVSRAMVAARALLADAALDPPEPGVVGGERDGLRYQREVRRTAHPALREIRVRVSAGDDATCELVEVIRVPAA